MTDEEKKQLQLLYDVSQLSIGLSLEQAELLKRLEDRFIADEVMPALGSHVLPLMQRLQGTFTLQVFQSAGQQHAYVERGDDEPSQTGDREDAPRQTGEPPEAEPTNEPAVPNEEKDPKKIRHHQRPNFRFSMVGIEPGEWVTFTPTGLRVKVVSDNRVEYDGQTYKLSPFVVKFLPDDMRNAKNAYQGPKYFAYKDCTLDSLRPDQPEKRKTRRRKGE